jgi:hypothetical protein
LPVVGGVGLPGVSVVVGTGFPVVFITPFPIVVVCFNIMDNELVCTNIKTFLN